MIRPWRGLPCNPPRILLTCSVATLVGVNSFMNGAPEAAGLRSGLCGRKPKEALIQIKVHW